MSKRFALIIEDNREIGDIYATTLQMAGFETETVLDGKLALDKLDERAPDLIILDMNLPQVSGHYIYKTIRSNRRLDNTVVIISTANTLVGTMLGEGLAYQDQLLLKPVTPRQLREVVDNLNL